MQSDSLEYIRPYLFNAAANNCHLLINIASYYTLRVLKNLASFNLACVSYYNAGFWLIMMSCTIAKYWGGAVAHPAPPAPMPMSLIM